MPYIQNDSHIVSPVSISDVKQCFGSGITDLATLCMLNNINWKSVYKPVYMNKIGILSSSDLANGRATAVSGYTISYGIKIRKSSVIADYIDTNAAAEYFPVKDAPWAYDKPVVDGVNVFRLTDFNNYWHNAEWAMGLSFPATSNIYVPQQSGETGQTINFTMNWNYSNYDKGWMTPQQIFAAIQNYYPSILLTCFYQGGSWNYAKSAAKPGGGYFTIGEIGASSAQSGCTVSIDTKKIYDTIGRSNPNSILEGRQWTACWVLLPTAMTGESGAFQVFFPSTPSINREVVRLQLPSPSTVVDRKVLTIVSKKKSYISSVTAAVTVQRTSTPSGSYHRWDVTSIVFTFEKETDDTINFVVKGSFTCQVGSAYVSGLSPDSSGKYTLNNSMSVTGRGTKTVTLSTNTIYYMPTAPESYSNVIRFSGTLYLEDSTYGNWQGSYGIESQPSEPFWTLSKNINLS